MCTTDAESSKHVYSGLPQPHSRYMLSWCTPCNSWSTTTGNSSCCIFIASYDHNVKELSQSSNDCKVLYVPAYVVFRINSHVYKKMDNLGSLDCLTWRFSALRAILTLVLMPRGSLWVGIQIFVIVIVRMEPLQILPWLLVRGHMLFSPKLLLLRASTLCKFIASTFHSSFSS